MIYFSWCLLLRTCLPATSDIVPSFSITDIYLQRFDGFFVFFTGDSVCSRLCHAPVTCFPAFFTSLFFLPRTLVWASRFVWFVFSCDGQSAMLILNPVLFSKLFGILYKMLWVLEWETKSRRILVSAGVCQQKLIVSKNIIEESLLKNFQSFMR